MPPLGIKILKILFGILLVVGSIALIRDTVYVGNDFIVFWRTAVRVLNMEAPYSVARDGAMVFKYPPWTVPLFFPIGMFSSEAARWIFGAFNVLCIAYIVRFLLRAKLNPYAVYGTLLCFWGIWAVHALDGQINLFMVVVALWVYERSRGFKGLDQLGGFSLVFALSTKVFTLFPLIALLRTKYVLEWKRWIVLFAGLVALSLPAVFASGSGSFDFDGAVTNWIEAAGSGGEQFHGEKVRGRENQGLPAFFLRAFSVPASEASIDLIAFSLIAIATALLWMRHTKSRSDSLYVWVGWLALVPVVHPLAWFHLWVFAFPLAVFGASWALEKIGANKKFVPGWLVLGLILSLTVVTKKTFGEFGHLLELSSIKAWAVVGIILVLNHYRRPIEAPSS